MSINAHLPSEGTGDGIARSSSAKLSGLLVNPSTDGFGINMGSARGGPCEESELGTCRFTAERDARSHKRPRGTRSLLGRALGVGGG